MHNSATPLFKGTAVAEPSLGSGVLNPWVLHTLRWVIFYTGWLSVIHLSMQHTWSTAGGLGVAAAWWVLLHWHPLSALQTKSWVTVLMGCAAALGLLISQHADAQILSVAGLLLYVLGLSCVVHAIDRSKHHSMQQSAGWLLASSHAIAITLALVFAANYLLWARSWPLFMVLMGVTLLLSLSRDSANTHRPTLMCQPDPTMALMMAFLPLYSLWCATPWLNATQHLGLHLISMVTGHVIMLTLLKRYAPADHHPLWGHALSISATGLIWATNDPYLMLVAMVLLSAGSIWTQLQRPLRRLSKSIALSLGALSITVTAHWAHTSGPDALGLGLFITSLIWTLSHMGLHIRSSYEQRRH
jgi:hypothetical protein